MEYRIEMTIRKGETVFILGKSIKTVSPQALSEYTKCIGILPSLSLEVPGGATKYLFVDGNERIMTTVYHARDAYVVSTHAWDSQTAEDMMKEFIEVSKSEETDLLTTPDGIDFYKKHDESRAKFLKSTRGDLE